MKIAFVGASSFGLRCLEAVLGQPGCEVVGILSLPETFSISYRPGGVRNVLHADFEPIARRHGIAFHVMHGAMGDPEIVGLFRSWKPDLVLAAGWYHLIPAAIRDIAPALGLHASLLPDYSGGAPLVWAMINGEKRAGITLFRFDDGVDSGPIVAQAEEPILDDDTIATLYARVEARGIELLQRAFPAIAAGRAQYRPQDASRRRVFPQRAPEDGRIDWRWPARRVYDFIRAQSRPYPGAFSTFRGERLTIWRAALPGAADSHPVAGVPGQIVPLPVAGGSPAVRGAGRAPGRS